MPGWHAKVEDAVAQGELQEFAVAPEQYGDRMALFMQWKEMTFPVLMDPLNILDVDKVPILLLVDQAGIIRFQNPSDKDLKEFLATEYQESRNQLKRPSATPHELAAATALIQDEQALATAIAGYQKLSQKNPKDAKTSFQLGVLLRARYDQGAANGEDFQEAVLAWSGALARTPSQYIWRRRIQQYGPQLDKPYPFYNWVSEARKVITARGETPLPLLIEPSGSEMAGPARGNTPTSSQEKYPAAQGTIPSGEKAATLEATLIPHTSKEGSEGHFRLHLRVTPKAQHHWTSDAQEAQLWLIPDSGEPRFLTSEITPLAADEEVSEKGRVLEGSLSSKEARSGKLVLFYFICSDDPPACTYLASELALAVPDSLR